MKSISQVLADMKKGGLIYDPLITAMIINYEAGHLLRNMFYASMVGSSEAEQQLEAAWLSNGRVELSDLITQARVLVAVKGWDYNEIVETGQQKLEERTADYAARGIRPNEALLARLKFTMNADLHELYAPKSTHPPRPPRREGD